MTARLTSAILALGIPTRSAASLAMFLRYQGNAAHPETLEESVGRLCGGWRWGGGKKEPPRETMKRDIVQNRPYTPFVDKWISMLINWDADMSENCGECGIILPHPLYTPTTVVRVCGPPPFPIVRLQVPFFSFLAEGVPLKFLCFRTKRRTAPHISIVHRSPLYPCGKVLVTAHLALYVLYAHNAGVVRSPTCWP